MTALIKELRDARIEAGATPEKADAAAASVLPAEQTASKASLRGWLTLALLLAGAGCASSNVREGAGSLAAAPAASTQDPPQTAAKTGDLDVQPEQLLGLDADQLTALLGRADFTRTDGPSEIRQFRGSDCILDVFLYREPAEGGYRVAHVEARDRRLAGTAQETCVIELLRARRLRMAAG